MTTRYVFVSGGVISGLGKGITAASLGLLLKSSGFKVGIMKADMYLNQDAGTMNPLEHGEVYVTTDGVETDQDVGHYERFLGNGLTAKNYLTAGQVYQTVLDKERRLGYGGKCVEVYLAFPQEIIRRIKKAGEDKDFLIIEYGGTVGEYQNILFFEALRRMKIEAPNKIFLIHVVYVPIPDFLGEMKTKPAQQSISQLNSLGLSPDIIVCRSSKALDEPRKEKLALSAAILPERIFSNIDVKTIYQVPLMLEEQGFSRVFFKTVGVKGRVSLNKHRKLLEKINLVINSGRTIKIGIAGKYYNSGHFYLSDAYVSVIESIKHAAWDQGLNPEIVWLDSEKLTENRYLSKKMAKVDALIVPGGFGHRGVEGKIVAIKFARENGIPFLGLCYGMQLAVVEFARNVLGKKKANSAEVDKKASDLVVHLMPEQEKKMLEKSYGGTMRLGEWTCCLEKGTHSYRLYQKKHWGVGNKLRLVKERHRHRFEFNNEYRQELKKAGLIIAGTTTDGALVEIIELSEKRHPFFVGVQFHPEFLSRPDRPHPLFCGLIEAAQQKLINNE